jgi:glycosyltransferase involved in cell wall biosynthesis
MRIALSLLAFRPGRIGGAETYLRKLVEHMPREAAGDTLLAVMDRDLAAELPTPGFERVVLPKSGGRVVAERILEAFTPWRARAVERVFSSLRADVVLFPQQSMYPRRIGAPAVLTVVDVQHLVFPDYFPLFDRLYRPRVYPRSMAAATKLIAISEFTRREVIGRCAVPEGKVVAVPLGASSHDVRGLEPYPGLRAPYAYYPAASQPHKGHETLFESFATLRRTARIPHRLVLSGVRTKHWRRLARRLEALGLGDDVEDLGYLSYADVQRVYAGADAVLFPTRYEGFGLPVLEAVEHGKKVIVSDIPVFEELGVPSEWRIDFSDPEELAAALARPGPTRLLRRPATWDECVRRTVEVLREVGSAPARSAGGDRPPAQAHAPRF